MSTKSSSPEGAENIAPVFGVQEGLITIDVSQTPVRKNEVGYVAHGDERLKAEVLRVQGNTGVAQVFEDTRGVRIGDRVEQSGRMLSIKLGPGLLGQVYDGLQNPLEQVANEFGFFQWRQQKV